MIEGFIIGSRDTIPEMTSEDVLQSLLAYVYSQQNITSKRVYGEVNGCLDMDEVQEIIDNAKEGAKHRYNKIISREIP
jgi:hypothetical protein